MRRQCGASNLTCCEARWKQTAQGRQLTLQREVHGPFTMSNFNYRNVLSGKFADPVNTCKYSWDLKYLPKMLGPIDGEHPPMFTHLFLKIDLRHWNLCPARSLQIEARAAATERKKSFEQLCQLFQNSCDTACKCNIKHIIGCRSYTSFHWQTNQSLGRTHPAFLHSDDCNRFLSGSVKGQRDILESMWKCLSRRGRRVPTSPNCFSAKQHQIHTKNTHHRSKNPALNHQIPIFSNESWYHPDFIPNFSDFSCFFPYLSSLAPSPAAANGSGL